MFLIAPTAHHSLSPSNVLVSYNLRLCKYPVLSDPITGGLRTTPQSHVDILAQTVSDRRCPNGCRTELPSGFVVLSRVYASTLLHLMRRLVGGDALTASVLTALFGNDLRETYSTS